MRDSLEDRPQFIVEEPFGRHRYPDTREGRSPPRQRTRAEIRGDNPPPATEVQASYGSLSRLPQDCRRPSGNHRLSTFGGGLRAARPEHRGCLVRVGRRTPWYSPNAEFPLRPSPSGRLWDLRGLAPVDRSQT